MTMEYPISLYYDTEVSDVKTLDLCRGDDDFRKIYIADDGHRKLVIKYLSNTFSDKHRIEGWFRLMDEYRKIGLYCPAVVPNRSGELLHCNTADGRDYYTYAEEYSVYETNTSARKNTTMHKGMFASCPMLCALWEKSHLPDWIFWIGRPHAVYSSRFALPILPTKQRNVQKHLRST